MAVERAQLHQVFQAFEESDWDEIFVSFEGFEVHLRAASSDQPAGMPGVDTGPASAAVVEVAPAELEAPARRTAEPSTGVGAADLVDAEVVASPSPGLFWRSPSPGAPPFTEEGVAVAEGDALCIVEVMKLMNTLSAPFAGTVVEICVANGEQVEAGQKLFLIRRGG